MDVLTPNQRKRSMQHNRSKDTSIEVVLRKALWAKGYRYRKNCKQYPGTPDIVLTKHKIAIFCDGEFFHGKDWEIKKTKLKKAENAEYWIKKIERNMERDVQNDQKLRFKDWTVMHFWGQDILNDTEGCITAIEEAIFENKIRKETREALWEEIDAPFL